MPRKLKIVLLLAKPASGKSEVRKYVREDVTPEQFERDFHMNPTVQIDDFPYVNLMRRVDEELLKRSLSPVFFTSPDSQFQDPRTWGVLIHMINCDYDDLKRKLTFELTCGCARRLIERINEGRLQLGMVPVLKNTSDAVLAMILDGVEKDAREIAELRNATNKDGLHDKTVVIEFARGGPKDATMPLPEYLGYAGSLCWLASEILDKAVIVYVQVETWQSWTKNFERAKPGKEGDDLSHCVPKIVMDGDYGTCDMLHLESVAEERNTVDVMTPDGEKYMLPLGMFDNRNDLTTQIRTLPAHLRHPDGVAALHNGLANAFTAAANMRDVLDDATTE